MERHHKDVPTRHRQQWWYIPGFIVRKIGQDVYAVQVGDNKILDRNHTKTPTTGAGSQRASSDV